jgi:hypothetical protein
MAAMGMVSVIGLACPSHAQVDDPFGGGFPFNYDAEILTMGTQNDSLHGWGYNWTPGVPDSIVLSGEGHFLESYQCGEIRDIAHGDFNADFLDELVVVWNRDDGGVFVGIPTIDPITLAPDPDPDKWHVPNVPIASGVLYATPPVLADVLGEIRVVAGNFYPDRPRNLFWPTWPPTARLR